MNHEERAADVCSLLDGLPIQDAAFILYLVWVNLLTQCKDNQIAKTFWRVFKENVQTNWHKIKDAIKENNNAQAGNPPETIH